MVRIEDLKVGMKVRIVDERTKFMNPSGRMDKYLGKVMTIYKINLDGDIFMEEDAGEYFGGPLNGWFWSTEMIEEIVTGTERGGDIMRKTNLELGMVVVLRNGDVRMVVNTTNMGVVLTNGTKAAELANYNDDLENKGSLGEAFDIMEVYGHPACGGRGGLLTYGITTESRELLWKRDESKEMTMEELNELLHTLGHAPVKIVE